VYANTRDEQDYTWHEVNKCLGEVKAPAGTRPWAVGCSATSIDFRYKVRRPG
jgi:hypothetical protein